MKEHPILFSAPMVLAILGGTKTQTRRVMKIQPEELKPGKWGYPASRKYLDVELGTFVYCDDPASASLISCQCPYGQPGDRLWVRETCQAEELVSGIDGVRYLADSYFKQIANTSEAAEQWGKLYHYGKRRGATVPPIHAPRWASRILLEIVSVRVERLIDCSNADAVAEGIELVGGRVDDSPIYRNYDKAATNNPADGYGYPRNSYYSLWESIHGEGSRFENPWVWVVEFKRILPSTTNQHHEPRP